MFKQHRNYFSWAHTKYQPVKLARKNFNSLAKSLGLLSAYLNSLAAMNNLKEKPMQRSVYVMRMIHRSFQL